jgi:hypothetical protein
MARQRTRSKSRKRTAQSRSSSPATAGKAGNRRADIRAKRRRAADNDPVRVPATPKEAARGGRARQDPNNRAKSKLYAPRVAEGKGGRPRSPRMRERIARRAA